MPKYRKRKIVTEAYQAGTHPVSDMEAAMRRYGFGRVDGDYHDGHIEVIIWTSKNFDHRSLWMSPGDWLVIRTNNKVRVLSNFEFQTKYEEDK